LKSKVIDVSEALDIIKDGDTIAISAAGVVGYPEYIVKSLEDRYLETQHPAGLTLYSGCGHGNPVAYGTGERFGHPGFLKRTVCTHPNVTKILGKFIDSGEIEGYCFPQGVLNQLYRCMGAKQPGLLTKIGIGTYIDPRQDGGKLNSNTTEDLVELVTVDGEEYLFFKSKPINVTIIRGTTADEFGNMTIEEEALKFETLEIALAAKASGGKVIVQVKNAVEGGTLKAKEVVIPGEIVDAVVVCKEPDLYHMQTAAIIYSPYLSGELKSPPGDIAEPKAVLAAEDIICRRAVYELRRGAIVNVGVGIGAGIGVVADVEGITNDLTFTLELGTFGGTPQGGPNFGSARNVTAYVAHPSMFDFYHGGGLDIAVLGAAQIDATGNVNVSKIAGRAAGQGGFIDISQCAKKVVFCTTFTTKGVETAVENGRLIIESDGSIQKIVEKVDQITFNGTLSREKAQEVVICTERAVFHLVKDGVMLTEIAPGVDLDKDILGKMGFKPIISDGLKEMDARIFTPGRMGCFD